jgi:hypothetical protein
MTTDKFSERYAGWVAFLVVLVGMSFVSLDYYDFREIINATPEVSISIFGILLAFMGIILQSPNDTIKTMLANDDNYETFMSYGSRVELNSALLTIYSLVVTKVHLSLFLPDMLSSYTSQIKHTIVAFFWAMIIKLVIDLYYYIRVFKLLFRSSCQ